MNQTKDFAFKEVSESGLGKDAIEHHNVPVTGRTKPNFMHMKNFNMHFAQAKYGVLPIRNLQIFEDSDENTSPSPSKSALPLITLHGKVPIINRQISKQPRNSTQNENINSFARLAIDVYEDSNHPKNHRRIHEMHEIIKIVLEDQGFKVEDAEVEIFGTKRNQIGIKHVADIGLKITLPEKNPYIALSGFNIVRTFSNRGLINRQLANAAIEQIPPKHRRESFLIAEIDGTPPDPQQELIEKKARERDALNDVATTFGMTVEELRTLVEAEKYKHPLAQFHRQFLMAAKELDVDDRTLNDILMRHLLKLALLKSTTRLANSRNVTLPGGGASR